MPNPTLEPVASPAAADATIGLKPGATEVVGLRTESSQTYDNHDGTMTSVFASSAKFYQPEGSSAWLPISVGFAAGSKTDGLVGAVPVVSSDRAPATVSLFNLTARDFVTVGTKGKSVGFALPLDLAKAAKPTAPIVDGVAADYRDVFPGADLRVIARASGSKAFVILHGVPADPRWTFRVDAPGLTLVPQANGSISLVDESGKAIGQIPHPYALDSTVDELAGDGRYTDQASVTLGQDTDGAPTITIAVDPAWLATAVYPVYVDPSVDIFHSTMVTADAHTSSSFPTTNYGTYQRPTSPYYYEMWLGLDPSGTSGTSHDYVRWDVSDLGTVTVESAQVSTHPWHQYYNAPTTIRSWIARLTSSFSESTITHNNRPSAGNDVAFIDGVEGQTSWSNPTSGFTGVVQGWVSTPATNYGVRIWQDGLGSTYWKRILASEDGTDVDYRPTLKVTWHVPTVTIVAPTGPTASKLLTWSYADSGSAPQTQYHVDVATADAFGGTIMSTSEDAGGSATSWTTPAALTEGATYYWRVRAFNGSSWSDWASSPFVWDATAPSVSAFTAPTTPTNATSLAYTTTFSEPVSGLAAGDFAISGTATGWSVTDVSGSGAGPYTITLTGGGAGTVILTLNANTVSDGASTGPASPSTAATVIVDQTVPSVSAFTAPASPTAETSLAYTTTFSEPVSGLAAGDFAISGTATGWSVTDVSGSGAGPYTITLTGGGAGTVILTLNANTVSDGASTGPASDVGATALSVGVDPTARWLLGTHTQLVVGNKNTPTAGDQAIRARLVAQGQSVTYVDDGDAPAVAGQNLIVIAASASAASLGTGYRNVAVPVLDLANASWDEMDYATATTHEPSGTALDVIDSSNSIAAGYSGSKTISTGGTLAYKLTSELAASAQKVWSITAQSSQVALFAYESGATMQNGHAAEARRVGLGWNDNVPTILNPTGWNVFDATARWLLGTHTQLVVGNKNTPTAGDQAIRARLVAQGQSVTYVDDGDAPAVAGQNLIVIAASASAASLGTGYRNVAVPVLDLANASWDEMDYATATTHEPSGTALDVIDSSNSIAAGYSGSKTISTGGTLAYKLTSELAASAQKVWSITAQSSQVALFAYESGATMQNGHAAEARRVGLGWNDNVPTILNPTGWNVFDATARWLLGTHTQLVVGNKNTPTAGDQAIRARLVAQGQSVTYVDDGDAPAVAGQNLIVIAASASAASLGTGYRNVAVPVLDLANASWDEMDYATATTHEPSGTALDVIDSSNSIAAGYSGSKTISTGGTLAYKLTSELAASAQKVWSITAQSSQVALFAYESGATMQNGHAAEARRVGLGWNDNVPTILNPTGWNVFDATARWLLGREARPGIWVEMAPIITVLRGTSTAQSLTLMAVQEATGASVEVDPAISNVVTLGVLGSPFHVEAGGTYDVPLIVDVPTSTALGTTSGQVKIVAADGQVVASITVTLDTVDPQSGIVPQGVASPSGDRIGTDAVGDTLVVDGLVVGLDFGTLDPDGRILQIAAAHGAKVLGGVPSGFMYDLQVPVANLAELQSARDAIASEANVTFVSRTYSSADLQAIPNDPRYAAWDQSNPSGNNWDLELIRAPLAWDTTTGDRAVRVAIVDADMAWDHPDVADNVDLHAGPRVPSPTQIGHGTHVAGTACASGNNGVGVTGVAWRCSLTEWEFGIWVMPGGAEPPKEEHFPNRAAWLMLMAADQGAQVVNMSFGWPYGECAEKPNDAEAQAKLDETNHIFAQSILAAQAHFKDVLWVAAAGNSYGCNSAWNSPAGLSAQFPNNFITVASVNQAGQLSAFSDIGNPITVAAPGGEDPKVQPVDAGIYNTLPFHCKILGFLDCNEGYGFLAGTSMAAPHVTGLAVLVWSAHPGMSAAQVRTCIVDGAASMGIAVQGQVFHVIDAPAAVTCNPGG